MLKLKTQLSLDYHSIISYLCLILYIDEVELVKETHLMYFLYCLNIYEPGEIIVYFKLANDEN